MHHGQKLKKLLDEAGVLPEEIGPFIPRTKQAIYLMFKKKTLDIALLIRFCDVLDVDRSEFYISVPDSRFLKRKKKNAA